MARRARILTLLTYYHPHWTGLTVYARNIAEGLAERGHEVTVLTSRHDDSLPEQEIVGGVRVRRLPTIGRVSRAVVMPSFWRVLHELLAAHDLVHIHSPMPEAALAVAAARRRGVPSLVTHQGDVVMPAGAMNRAIQAVMDVTLTYAVRRADAVVTHSGDYAERSRLLTRRGRAVQAIAPPTLIPQPVPEKVRLWKDELGLTGRPVVGFAGRFVEEKGFDFLLEAVPAVRAAVPDVHFVFAGETGVVYERFFEQCQPMLAEHADAFTSLGLVLDRQRMADFYALCDLFVVPSRSDCFAGVQVEALLCGTPLVTADIAGAREIIQRTGMGRLVRPRDPAALATGIIGELWSPRPRPERAEVLSLYDPRHSVARYAQLVDQLTAGRWPDPDDGLSSSTASVTSAPTVDRLGLSAVARSTLDQGLRNEPDLAYRRRVVRLFELIDRRDGDCLLDLGSGTGALSMAMAAVGTVDNIRVDSIAVDHDIVRLRQGASEGCPARPVCADALRLPFPADTFDRVLAAEIVEHVADDVAALREIGRVLRPGGVAVMSVPHANYPLTWDPLGVVRDSAGLAPNRDGWLTGQWSGHQRLYLPAELRDVVDASGLVVEVVEEQTPYPLPLSHLLVYSIGKPLMEQRRLPDRLDRALRRDQIHAAPTRVGERGGLGARLLEAADRRNDRPRPNTARFVGIVARAVKPSSE